MSGEVALVAGASGIIGSGVVEALAGQPDWRTRLLASRAIAGQEMVAVDHLEEHGLRETPYDKLVGWGFGDSIFNTDFDMISTRTKFGGPGGTKRLIALRHLWARSVD